MIRGALRRAGKATENPDETEDQSSALRHTINGATSPSELVSAMQEILCGVREPEHLGLSRLWRLWLREQVLRYQRRGAGHLIDSMPKSVLQDDPEAPLQHLHPSGDAIACDPDDGVEITTGLTIAEPADVIPRDHHVQLDLARAQALWRRSEGDLLMPADRWLPGDAIRAFVERALETHAGALRKANLMQAEDYAALLLVISTGVREVDLPSLRWGTAPSPGTICMDPNAAVLYRPVLRPPHAVHPDSRLKDWLEPCGMVIAWPLPESVDAALRGLTHAAVEGQPVLPFHARREETIERLQSTMRLLNPDLAVGSQRFRLALASRIAAQLGADVAQLAMGDAFSLSTAPTYYSAPRQSDITRAILSIQTDWFPGAALMPRVAALDSEVHLGSLLVLRATAAQQWPRQLRKARHSLDRSKHATLRARWTAHRNYLAGALMAVTGHRPVDAIGQLRLYDVVPEHALVVLSDKRADPLRRYRLAGTGRRWIGALRVFLDALLEMREISAATPQDKALIDTILGGQAALFDVPGGEAPVTLTMMEVRQTMPETLRAHDNWYRHRLNHALQRCGIEPELRNAQMGWVICPAYATADLSPYAPAELGARLAPALDAFLVEDEWMVGGEHMTAWSWRGIPMPPLEDWSVREREHRAHFDADLRDVRESMRTTRKEVRAKLLPNLARAFTKVVPMLTFDQSRHRLVRTSEVELDAPRDGGTHDQDPGGERALDADTSKPRARMPRIIEIDEAVLDLLLTHTLSVCEDPTGKLTHAANASPLQAIVARTELVRLLRRSHGEGLTRGPLPRVPVLSLTGQPTPFMPGLGMAVRQAEQVREALVKDLHDGHAMRTLAWLTVLIHSPYRRALWADAAVRAAATAARVAERPGILRLDAMLGATSHQMVFGGIPAIVLAQRAHLAPTAHPPTPALVADWLRSRFPGWDENADGSVSLACIESLARAAGRIELTGTERVLLLDEATLHTVAARRCLALDGDWPAETNPDTAARRAAVDVRHDRSASDDKPVPRPAYARLAYGRLASVLNPAKFATMRGKAGKGRRGWRTALAKELEHLLDQQTAQSNVGLLVTFALDRLRHGGVRLKQLEHRTIQTAITRFGRALLELAGPMPLYAADAEVRTQLYLAVLNTKSPAFRARVSESLQQFDHFLVGQYVGDTADWNAIKATLGMIVDSADPAIVTNAEVQAVIKALSADRSSELARTDGSPAQKRLTMQRWLAFVIQEAAGLRTAAVYGLLLTDMLLLGAGADYVHLHARGGYGSIKTDASEGFTPLQGTLWTHVRADVIAWLAQERAHCAGLSPARVPLFSHVPGDAARVPQDLLYSRIHELMRWATGLRDAHAYWLRKRRILARHRAAQEMPTAWAIDVRAVLADSGQVAIRTPLEAYIADPAVPLTGSLRIADALGRAALFAAAGPRLSGKAGLDMAWMRAKDTVPGMRVGIVLSRQSLLPTMAPAEHWTDPPPQPVGRRVVPSDIAAYARARQKSPDLSIEQVGLFVGLDINFVNMLEHAAQDLTLQRQCAPWDAGIPGKGIRILPPPRRLPGTEPLFSALDLEPSDALRTIASIWVRRSSAFVDAEHGEMLVLLDAREATEVTAALHTLGIAPTRIVTHPLEQGLHGLSLSRASPSSPETHPHERRVSLLAALRWVSSLVWLYERVTNCPRTAPSVVAEPDGYEPRP